MASSREALIIGIDFGTTFSGVAWVYTGTPNKIRLIQNWPGSGAQNYDKVQTILAYNERNKAKYKWGYEINDDTPGQLAWFKLLLDQEQDRNSLVQMTANWNLNSNSSARTNLSQLQATIAALPAGKKPVDLVTDYLRGIYTHTMATINKAYPSGFTEQLGKEICIKYCLTVPAVWSDKAKSLTIQAAKAAGMKEENSEIRVISEPEAAAVHCLKTFKETQNCLKVGDIYVIADCGGGTVDLISYEITAVEPRLKVKECATGTGGLCGSTTLNRRFEALVKSKLGHPAFTSMGQHAKQTTLKHFDKYLKVVFNPRESGHGNSYDDDDDDEDEVTHVHCPVPGIPSNPAKGISGGFLLISTDEMKDVFAPSFSEITQLVQEQVRAAEERSRRSVTGVLLVGGFGSSKYLYKHLSTRIKSRASKQVKILQPTDAWTAIVQGAVLDSIAMHQSGDRSASDDHSMVQSRIARCSYGTLINEVFVDGKHPIRNRYWDKLEGIYRCRNRMTWLVKKGEEIPSRIPISKELYLKQELDSDLVYEETVFCSVDESPPLNYEEYGAGIRQLCVYEADFRNPSGPLSTHQRTSAHDGKKYWYLKFKINLHYDGYLTFSSSMQGKELGAKRVEYNHAVPLY